jgi:hypothetical protein
MPETAGMDVLGGPFVLLANADEPTVGEGRENKEEDVKKLQEALKKLGYDPGPIDGKWGEKTKAALKKFQKDHGLEDDGVAGPKTWEAINQALAELEGKGEDKGDKPAKPGDVEKVKTLNELLKELEGDMTEEQKKKYKELEKKKIDKLLKELEEALKKWGQSADEGWQENIHATHIGTTKDGLNERAAHGAWTDVDKFVALPCKKAKGSWVEIVLPDGTTAKAPVGDLGPWNENDCYWEEGRRPRSETEEKGSSQSAGDS